jgi:hypothetical protein
MRVGECACCGAVRHDVFQLRPRWQSSTRIIKIYFRFCSGTEISSIILGNSNGRYEMGKFSASPRINVPSWTASVSIVVSRSSQKIILSVCS